MFAGRRVAITGVSGTVGAEMLRQLVVTEAATIRGIDNNESELFFLGEQYRSDDRVSVGLADIRDRESLVDAFTGADVVFHVAALKQVPLCEAAPLQAIQTNITGTQNMLDVAASCGVERVVFTSTDKAVNPTNVMGTSKLMAERLVTAAAQRHRAFTAVSTRFGNVLGSRGSVLPLFARQIRAGGPVTLTSPEMTRFVMTLDQAVQLVLRSAFLGQGGEVFITKMPIARIDELATTMIDLLAPAFGHDPAAIEISEIGARPGEKLYEELMNEEEMRRSFDIGDFIVVEPALTPRSVRVGAVQVDRPYNSAVEPAMSKDDLAAYLQDSGLIDGLLGSFRDG